MERSDHRYLTSVQAAGALGVSVQTLYAYTSRGQVQSEPVPGRPRERRYPREDIERMRERKEARRDPAAAAARGLHWGTPVLASGITLIQEGRLFYRGQDSLQLAETASLEQVAELLWAAEEVERGRLFTQPGRLSTGQLARLRRQSDEPLAMFQMALPLAGAADLASHDLRPAAVRQTGARILRLMVTILSRCRSGAPVHEVLQALWAPRNPEVGSAIRTALVLCADHELNVSAFVARCAASAGASPYDVVAAALATLKGQRHGGETQRVSALVSEVPNPRQARAVLADRLRRGDRIPGFGHPLYPAGDPRAALLLRLAEEGRRAAEWRLIRSVVKAGTSLLQDRPNLDLGLVALAHSHGLPAQAPLILFALGRTAGWIAHALEQYSGDLIRPRARYVGPAPAV